MVDEATPGAEAEADDARWRTKRPVVVGRNAASLVSKISKRPVEGTGLFCFCCRQANLSTRRPAKAGPILGYFIDAAG